MIYPLTKVIWYYIGFVDSEGRPLYLKMLFIWIPFGFILGYGVFPTCIAIDIAMNIFLYMPFYLVKNRVEVMQTLRKKTLNLTKSAMRLFQSTKSLFRRDNTSFI